MEAIKIVAPPGESKAQRTHEIFASLMAITQCTSTQKRKEMDVAIFSTDSYCNNIFRKSSPFCFKYQKLQALERKKNRMENNGDEI